MSDYIVEHLIGDYQGKDIFILNDNEVAMELKDVLISGLKVVKTNSKPIEVEHPTFRDRFFPGMKNLPITRSINPSSVVVREVRSRDEGQSMSNLYFKRIVYLFVMCTTLFPCFYYNVLPHDMGFVSDIENFKTYL